MFQINHRSLLFFATLSLCTWAQTTPDSVCKLGTEWTLKSTTEGHFLADVKDSQTAKLFVIKDDDAAMGTREYRAMLTLEKGPDCLLKQEGKNDPDGSVKVPTENSVIFALPLTPTRDILRVIDTYSHGYTQEDTYLFLLEKSFGDKIVSKQLWEGSTYSIDPKGNTTMNPMALKLDDTKKVAVITHKRKGVIRKWIWDTTKAVFAPVTSK